MTLLSSLEAACWCGSLLGQKELCCGRGFAPPHTCAPHAHGEAEEWLHSKSAYRNQLRPQRGHEAFARHPYGNPVTGTLYLVQQNTKPLLLPLFWNLNMQNSICPSKQRSFLHAKPQDTLIYLPFDKGAPVGWCWGDPFSPEPMLLPRIRGRGHCTVLLTHKEKILWGIACILQTQQGWQGMYILEVKVILRCYKQ